MTVRIQDSEGHTLQWMETIEECKEFLQNLGYKKWNAPFFSIRTEPESEWANFSVDLPIRETIVGIFIDEVQDK